MGQPGSMAPVRVLVARWLLDHGSVTSDRGQAPSALREACGYEGSPSSFSQLLARMDLDGLIEREIVDVRCFEIRLTDLGAATFDHLQVDLDWELFQAAQTTPEAVLETAPEAPKSSAEFDYDELVLAVRRLLQSERLPAEFNSGGRGGRRRTRAAGHSTGPTSTNRAESRRPLDDC
jgi:DNA-binding MarR family transcriptional regulator